MQIEVCVWLEVSGTRAESVCMCECAPMCAYESMCFPENNLECCFTGIVCLFPKPGSTSVASDSRDYAKSTSLVPVLQVCGDILRWIQGLKSDPHFYTATTLSIESHPQPCSAFQSLKNLVCSRICYF